MAEQKNVRYLPGTVGSVTPCLIGKEGSEKPVIVAEVTTAEGTHEVYLYLSQGALPYTVEKCRAMGLPEGRSLTYLDENPNALQGNPVQVKLYEEQYEGEWRKKADIAQKRAAKKMDPKQLSAFDGLFAAYQAPDELPI